MDKEFKRHIQSLTDESLLCLMKEQACDYVDEALEVVNQVVEARGGLEALSEKVERAKKERQEVKERKLKNQRTKELDEARERDHALTRKSLLTDVRTLKDETIGSMSQTMIVGASGKSEKVLLQIQEQISASNMPLNYRMGLTEVKTKHIISRVRRDFLIIETKDFPDHHAYISVRDFGIYLDCVLFFTIEPGALKRFLSRKLTRSREVDALSRPKNILKLQDLNSWRTIVKAAFDAAIKVLVAELGKKPGQVLERERTFLEIW